MNRVRAAAALTAALIVASPWSLGADVRTDEKNRVEFGGAIGKVMGFFGGKAAKEGVTSSVALKGDRKATMSGDKGQIIDLAEEKVYDLDMDRKTYKVRTFAEIRRQMEEDRKKAEEQARKAQEQAAKAQERQEKAQPDKNAKEMQIDLDIKETGQRKSLNGFDTRQVVMTVTMYEKGKTLEQAGGMVLTNDMWLTAKIPALQEIQAFDMRYYQQLASPVVAGASAEQMAMALAQFPGMKDAMAKAQTEGSKLDGTPILTTVTFDTVKSPEQAASEKKTADDDSDSAQSGGMSGMFGGLARRMAKKKSAGDDASKGDAASARSTFMTSTHEVLKVTPTVASTDVAIPAGFQQK